MRHLLIERTDQGLEIARVEDGRLTDHVTADTGGLHTEQVMTARALTRAGGINAWFMRLPDGQTGFLQQTPAHLSAGDLALVQVKKPPVGKKAAFLTTDIALPARDLILLPVTDRLAVSSRADKEDAPLLYALGQSLKPDKMGLIVRHGALQADRESLLAQLTICLQRWALIKAGLERADGPALLYEGRTPLMRALDDLPPVDMVLSDRADDSLPDGAPPIAYDAAPFARFGVRAQRLRLTARRVELRGGGFLITDPTEALTVIDVNTGSASGSGSDKEALFLRTDLEAVRTIAQILRVRDIGGIVIIDLIDLKDEKDRQTVLDEMKAAVLRDPVKCVVHGFTALGLMEMTRKRG